VRKNLLPILLIAGAAIAFIALRRRNRVDVSAGPTEKITREQFESSSAIAPTRSTAIDIGTKLVSSLFTKGSKAQRTAVKRAVRTKTATRAQAKAVTKQLSKGIRVAGFGDNVLV
jgi:hypothetical protein